MECYKILKYMSNRNYEYSVGDTSTNGVKIVKIELRQFGAEIYFSNCEMLFVRDIDFAYFRPIK